MNNLSWVEISKSAFHHNITYFSSFLHADDELAIVVKSNAYGHGIREIGLFCQSISRVSWLCTANLSEAIILRKSGVTKKILLLSFIDADIDNIFTYHIDVVVYDLEQVKQLAQHAFSLKSTVHIHIKIDTGLSRLGIPIAQANNIITRIRAIQGVNIVGIFTHLAEAESEHSEFTKLQVKRLEQLKQAVEQQGIQVPYYHYSSSAGIWCMKNQKFTLRSNLVRLGIGAYGIWPSPQMKQDMTLGSSDLRLVLTWKSKIIQTKQILEGDYVGYGRTFQATQRMTIAILPVGYWDGYDRGFTGSVLIGGIIAPVIGRICMNMIMVDITHLTSLVSRDDEVILMGEQHPHIHPNNFASNAGTIAWEVVTRINPLLRRIIIA